MLRIGKVSAASSSRARLLTGLLASLAPACGAGHALAQGHVVELRLSDFNPPSSPGDKAMVEWAADVEKASGGTIKATVFPAQQLGKAFDQYDMVRDGIADLAYVVPTYQPGRFPIIGAAELPLVFGNGAAGTKAFDQWYRPYAAREMRDVKFCYAFVLEPGTFHSRKQITLPADLRGLKVRPAQSTIAALISSQGGTNVQGAAPEARDLMEKGVADAVAFPYGSLVQFGLDKLTQFHLGIPLYSTGFVFVMNADKYAALSPDQKKVIDNHCNTDWANRVGASWSAFERAGEVTVRTEPGQTIVSVTPDQVEQWRKASQPLVEQWAKGVRATGGNPDAILNGLKQAVADNNAGP